MHTVVATHPSQKGAKDPDFLLRRPTMVACAAFLKESRMKFVDPTKPNRKSGEEGAAPNGGPGRPELRTGSPIEAVTLW